MDVRELFKLFARCCPGFEEYWRSDENLSKGGENDPHGLCLEICAFYIDYAEHKLPPFAKELFAEIENVLAADSNDEDDVANALCTCFIRPLVGYRAGELSRSLFGVETMKCYVEEENARRRGDEA